MPNPSESQSEIHKPSLIPHTNNDASTSTKFSIQKFLGFRERHEFLSWSFFSCFMTLLILKTGSYLHPPNFQAGSIPGEWFGLRINPYYFGIFLHLYTALPAGGLAVIQFIPAIRNKVPWVHTYMGYTIMTLLTLANIGIIMTSPVTLGGNDMSHVSSNYALIFLTSIAMFLAWYYIRRQQIDQHRKWMLRAMFWMGTIVTMRFIMVLLVAAAVINGKYVTLWRCEEVLFVVGDINLVHDEFPSCITGLQTYVGVPANTDSPLHFGSLFRLVFASAVWIAIVIHSAGVELYLHFTKKEDERLAKISYRKQLALGLIPPIVSAGSASIPESKNVALTYKKD